jgi:methyl-accepting chemotaxis protein
MNRNIMDNYDASRVNRFNIILIFIFSTMLTAQAFITGGAEHGRIIALLTYSSLLPCITAYVFYWKKYIGATPAALIICLSPFVSSSILLFLKYNASKQLIIK